MQATEQISNQSYDTTISYVEKEVPMKKAREAVSFYQLYCYFIVYSFVGWVWETVFTSIDTGELQQRGFLDVPILPIYGFAIVFITFLFYGKGFNVAQIFFGSALITSVQEFTTSWAMEKMFHQVWWDYSQMTYQIQGRICLLATVSFGVASVIVVKLVHPRIEKLVQRFLAQANSKKICVFSVALILADVVIKSLLLTR